MKNFILAVFAVTAVTVSCKKQETVNPALVTSTVEVSLGNPATKVFGDGTTESFEKDLNNVTVFVYEKGTNNCVLVRPFTAYEMDKQKAVFTIPDVKAQTEYDFYAVANCTSNDLTDETSMIARPTLEAKYEGVDGSTESAYGTLSSYNGQFADVTTKAVRGADASTKDNAGFIMSGNATERTPAKGTNTPTIVNLELKRTVARVAVRAAQTSEFYKDGKYPVGSTLKITNAKLKNVAASTTLFAKSSSTIALLDDPLEQTPNVVTTGTYPEYQNLFYIYENGVEGQTGAVAEANRPVLELEAEFDFDGDPKTTTDISKLTYNIKLAGEAGDSKNTSDAGFGLFVRNGNYLINVSINGLTENEVVASIVVKDWKTLQTQTVKIGK